MNSISSDEKYNSFKEFCNKFAYYSKNAENYKWYIDKLLESDRIAITGLYIYLGDGDFYPLVEKICQDCEIDIDDLDILDIKKFCTYLYYFYNKYRLI